MTFAAFRPMILFRLAGWLGLLLMAAACQAAVTPVAIAPTVAVTAVSQTPAPAATVTITASVTATATATPTPTATETPTPTATVTPSRTATATATAVPTATPTAPPAWHPFAGPDEAAPTPATPIPTPVPALAKPNHITTIVLLGNDVAEQRGGRTDSIMIVAINHQSKTASLLSVPRDLYVYIPGWTMNRVNLATPRGFGPNFPQGGGELVKETLLYNLGIPVDYYVRLGFDGFTKVIDAIGGVEMVVNCSLRDWRLIEPDLDPQVEEHWQQFTLEPGVHQLDGDLALWYVRSRRTTNDFDRGRRQQQVVRAVLNQGVDRHLIPQLPTLWQTFRSSVETDLTLAVVLELAALAPAVRENGVQHLYLSGDAVRAWRVPVTRESVQLLQWPAAEPVIAQLFQPPLIRRGGRPPISVEVVTHNPVLYRQAAENLAWYGFAPRYSHNPEPDPTWSYLVYYGSNLKGAYDWLMGWLFQRNPNQISLAPAPEEGQSYYRAVLGQDYDPCRPHLLAPTMTP